MEELLNKLIEKGWKPYWFIVQNAKKPPYSNRYYLFENCADWRTLRELVSKESWLWQFVCMNKLENPKERKQRSDLDEYNKEYVKYSTKFYEYWLIESALCDEEDLEKFLLDNIKL